MCRNYFVEGSLVPLLLLPNTSQMVLGACPRTANCWRCPAYIKGNRVNKWQIHLVNKAYVYLSIGWKIQWKKTYGKTKADMERNVRRDPSLLLSIRRWRWLSTHRDNWRWTFEETMIRSELLFFSSVCVCVYQYHYKPGQAQRVLRKLRFPDNVTAAQDGGRLSALRTGRP